MILSIYLSDDDLSAAIVLVLLRRRRRRGVGNVRGVLRRAGAKDEVVKHLAHLAIPVVAVIAGLPDLPGLVDDLVLEEPVLHLVYLCLRYLQPLGDIRQGELVAVVEDEINDELCG